MWREFQGEDVGEVGERFTEGYGGEICGGKCVGRNALYMVYTQI